MRGQGNNKVILHGQAGLVASTADLLDLKKKKFAKPVKRADDLGGTASMSVAALSALQSAGKDFLKTALNRTSNPYPSNAG